MPKIGLNVKIGDKFGDLEVIKIDNYYNIICKCICGKEKNFILGNLKGGSTLSCGCLKKSNIGKANRTHGLTKHPLFGHWRSIKRRCYDKNNSGYKHYGNRGIIICKEWLDDFKNFYDWAIENGWEKGLSIERIDVNGNYEPSNCTWIPRNKQLVNKTTTFWIEAFGEKKALSEWARDERAIVSDGVIRARILKGWDSERAITQPLERPVKRATSKKTK